LTGANHVCCADQAGVVRTNNVAKLYGVFWVGNGKPNEAVLPVPPATGGVARRSIPGGWGDDLVIRNLPSRIQIQ